VSNPRSTADVRFAVSRSRRNGIDRLSLVGALDRASVLTLEDELNSLTGTGGALVIDLRDLTSIDRWGLHTIERIARRSNGDDPHVFIVVDVNAPVADAFEAAGIGDLLGGADVSDLLDAGDGEWSPISPPPLPGRRAGRRLHAAEERP
jgi:anti-anti-sigma regulatory factor